LGGEGSDGEAKNADGDKAVKKDGYSDKKSGDDSG
jgi:hypothetical protein